MNCPATGSCNRRDAGSITGLDTNAAMQGCGDQGGGDQDCQCDPEIEQFGKPANDRRAGKEDGKGNEGDSGDIGFRRLSRRCGGGRYGKRIDGGDTEAGKRRTGYSDGEIGCGGEQACAEGCAACPATTPSSAVARTRPGARSAEPETCGTPSSGPVAEWVPARAGSADRRSSSCAASKRRGRVLPCFPYPCVSGPSRQARALRST